MSGREIQRLTNDSPAALPDEKNGSRTNCQTIIAISANQNAEASRSRMDAASQSMSVTQSLKTKALTPTTQQQRKEEKAGVTLTERSNIGQQRAANKTHHGAKRTAYGHEKHRAEKRGQPGIKRWLGW